MSKEEQDKKIYEKILENYNHLNEKMVEELDLASVHNGLTGNYREEMWIEFFRSIIPKKFSLAQGVMIIDSDKNVSKEVDIAVFDEQYTPYVFQYNTLKFIPIEAVAVVIECKSSSLNYNKLCEWADKLKRLKPKRSGITRIVNGYVTGLTNESQKRTRPITILASIKNNETDKPLNEIKEDLGDYFDFIILEENKKFEVLIKYEDKSLGWWGCQLNGTEFEENLKLDKLPNEKDIEGSPELKFDGERYITNTLKDLRIEKNPLLSLNLQLNQLLMLINNPMLFPHFAYAKAFQKLVKKWIRKNEGGKF